MDNEVIENVAEVVENAEVVEATEKVTKSLPNAAYVGIGALAAGAVAGLGTLLWKKVIKPGVDKLKKDKDDKKESDQKQDEEDSATEEQKDE